MTLGVCDMFLTCMDVTYVYKIYICAGHIYGAWMHACGMNICVAIYVICVIYICSMNVLGNYVCIWHMYKCSM